MNERAVFALCVLLIIGGYQYYWIRKAVSEQRKWAAIINTGAAYMGIIASIDHDYARYGERLNVYVRLSLPDRGDMLLRNWPVIKHCPYVAGSEAEIFWSPDYPEEFVFTAEAVWRLRGLNPVESGRINTGIFKFRFFFIWAIAVAVILLGFGALEAIK